MSAERKTRGDIPPRAGGPEFHRKERHPVKFSLIREKKLDMVYLLIYQ